MRRPSAAVREPRGSTRAPLRSTPGAVPVVRRCSGRVLSSGAVNGRRSGHVPLPGLPRQPRRAPHASASARDEVPATRAVSKPQGPAGAPEPTPPPAGLVFSGRGRAAQEAPSRTFFSLTTLSERGLQELAGRAGVRAASHPSASSTPRRDAPRFSGRWDGPPADAPCRSQRTSSAFRAVAS